MSDLRLPAVLAVLVLLAAFVRPAAAEEIWLADNTRLYGLVSGLKGEAFEITLASGEVRTVPLKDAIAISFRGRTPRFVESGTQELVFLRGGALRGTILGQSDESVVLMTCASGPVAVDMRKLMGMIGLPLEGAVGRRAVEWVAMMKGPDGPHLDQLLDRRGSRYVGVAERVDRAGVLLDHEDVLRGVAFAWGEVAAVRLADADKSAPPPLPAGPYARLAVRDGSRFDGVLQSVHAGSWRVRPLWEETRTIPLDISEVVSVQIMGGKVQYLSELPVSSAKETPLIAPPHSHRIDRNCEGGELSIGGASFPWGIGVHANSELTYDLGRRFSRFCATIGLDGNAGREGTVVFRVSGDGKELYRSPVMKGGDAPAQIAVDIRGVNQLTLAVGDADGSDLGDAADWGVARVVR
jgi:hypothetical protein